MMQFLMSGFKIETNDKIRPCENAERTAMRKVRGAKCGIKHIKD